MRDVEERAEAVQAGYVRDGERLPVPVEDVARAPGAPPLLAGQSLGDVDALCAAFHTAERRI